MPPVLYIFSGLPSSGKTTLSQKLAKELSATYLRVDTIEQGIKDLCSFNVQGEGYRLSYRIASDNLKLGISVVADSCNPINLTRREWEAVALESGSKYLNIEIACSNKSQHRNRSIKRHPTIPGLKLPTWDEIQNREYHSWSKRRITIDTADKSIERSYEELKESINLHETKSAPSPSVVRSHKNALAKTKCERHAGSTAPNKRKGRQILPKLI